MWRNHRGSNGLTAGMSLVEVLVVVAVIGIISAIAIPMVSNFRESAKEAAAMKNAKTVAQMSGALAALGVAHVIPDSMGGPEATARLLREGVTVAEGPMAGEVFIMPGMTDDQIEEVAVFLDVKYDRRELRLEFVPPADKNAILEATIRCYDSLCQLRESLQLPGVAVVLPNRVGRGFS